MVSNDCTGDETLTTALLHRQEDGSAPKIQTASQKESASSCAFALLQQRVFLVRGCAVRLQSCALAEGMGDPLTEGSAHSRAFAVLALFATVLSCLASALMLWLIAKLNRWNGHLLLITTMTVFQALYDVSFYSAVIDVHNVYVTVPSNIAQIIGGIGSSLVSNVVAAIAFYVIFRRKSFPIFEYYAFIMVAIISTALCNALLFLLSVTVDSLEHLADDSVLGFYYYTRLASIGFNFTVAVATMFQIRRTRSGRATTSALEQDINRLSLRLFYYPLVQAVSRSGAAWYEMKYGYRFSPSTGYNFSPEHTSDWAFAAQCTMALSMPVASVGYLVIFLIMQPRSLMALRYMLRCRNISSDLSAGLLSNVLEFGGSGCPRSDGDGDGDGNGDSDGDREEEEGQSEGQSDDQWRQSLVSVATVSDL